MTVNGGKLELGAAEWLMLAGILTGALVWAFAMHQRMAIVETLLNAEVPRMSRHLEELAAHAERFASMEARVSQLEREEAWHGKEP